MACSVKSDEIDCSDDVVVVSDVKCSQNERSQAEEKYWSKSPTPDVAVQVASEVTSSSLPVRESSADDSCASLTSSPNRAEPKSQRVARQRNAERTKPKTEEVSVILFYFF